jgi:lipoprotein-anchoring transpeptidase ErfK/SrfK
VAQSRWWDDAFSERRAPAYSGNWGSSYPNYSYQQGYPYQGYPSQRSYPFWDSAPSTRNDQTLPPGVIPGEIRDGGPRPEIAAVAPPIVPFRYNYPVNSIVIDVGTRQLYFVLAGRQAYQYQISVGREGFGWTGTEAISRKQEWPDWYPPAEMRQRDPKLPAKMTGGLNNPLGAMALYLGNTLYRIHGTNDEKSIGQAQSSGCFRMMNANVLHLATLADAGTTVSVVAALDPGQQVSEASRPPPPRPAVRQQWDQSPPRSYVDRYWNSYPGYDTYPSYRGWRNW